jgi:hypothetical protein
MEGRKTWAWGFWTSTPLDLWDFVHSTRGSWMKVSKTLSSVSRCALKILKLISHTLKNTPSYPVIPSPSIIFCKQTPNTQFSHQTLEQIRNMQSHLHYFLCLVRTKLWAHGAVSHMLIFFHHTSLLLIFQKQFSLSFLLFRFNHFVHQ